VPFLPLLPTQILLNNFLYDVSQIAIPADRVDDIFVRKPHHWDVRMLRRFMLRAGAISSVFDLITFGVLLAVFRASPTLFRTGWFVESLLTQTLVLLVVRTSKHALRAAPSPALSACIVITVCAGVALPYTALSSALGFTPLPAPVAGFVAVTTLLYLGAMEIAKRYIVPEIMSESTPGSPVASGATAAFPRAAHPR
jgi:Mg2+-importing ATPase